MIHHARFQKPISLLNIGFPVAALKPIIPSQIAQAQALSQRYFFVTIEIFVFVMLPDASKPVTRSVGVPHNVDRYHLMRLLPSQ